MPPFLLLHAPMKLSHRGYQEVLACIEAIHQCRNFVDFPGGILAALSGLIPSNLSAFNEVNSARNRITAVTDRPLDSHALLAAIWEKYSFQHPLLRYTAETGDGQAVKISDFLSTRDYHRLELYREFYQQLRAEDQMTVTIRSDDGVFLTLAFNRARRDFCESDRVKLNLVRPHILQAYSNAEELSGHLKEKADLKTALRETGHGLISLSRNGAPGPITPGAMESLGSYFPGWQSGCGLPRAITEWLQQGDSRSFETRGSNGRLIVRRAGTPDRRLLLLSEETDRKVPDHIGLTPREHEVLQWLAMGKTNPEIAGILGVAPGTVKMHVQRILEKLDVDNRTTATLRAREWGLRAPRGLDGAP